MLGRDIIYKCSRVSTSDLKYPSLLCVRSTDAINNWIPDLRNDATSSRTAALRAESQYDALPVMATITCGTHDLDPLFTVKSCSRAYLSAKSKCVPQAPWKSRPSILSCNRFTDVEYLKFMMRLPTWSV